MNPLKLLWTILLVGGLASINLWGALAYRQTLRPPSPPSPPPGATTPKPTTVVPSPPGEPKDKQISSPPTKPPWTNPNPPGQQEFDRLMAEGREHQKAKRLREAVAAFKAAKGLRPDDTDAGKALREAEDRLREFTEAYDKGRKALAAGQFDDAVTFLRLALTLVPDDKDAAVALAEAMQKAPPPQPLTGSAVVLLLHTRASRFTTSECVNQLKDVRRDEGEKVLLGGRIYCLTTAGCIPWDPGVALPPDAAWDDHDFAKMFGTAFQQIDALAGRAVEKQVRAVLVWETDVDPTAFPEIKVALPTGHPLRLCYRFTDRNHDSDQLAEWFGANNAARMKNVEDLKGFVEYYLTH